MPAIISGHCHGVSKLLSRNPRFSLAVSAAWVVLILSQSKVRVQPNTYFMHSALLSGQMHQLAGNFVQG